jgi:hypothetical protein
MRQGALEIIEQQNALSELHQKTAVKKGTDFHKNPLLRENSYRS